MANAPITNAVVPLKWQRGVFIATVLLLLSFPHYSYGQETATLSADEATASDTTGGEDVTDLGDVVVGDDTMADLTELVEDLEKENVAEECATDTDAAEEDASATPAIPVTDDAEIAEATEDATTTDEAESNAENAAKESDATTQTEAEAAAAAAPVVQSGPFIDLLGETLLSLEMVDDAHAQVHQHYTNEALSGKKVVGLYFSADWCGPCRQFTPDLVNFYNKMNARRGKQNEFEIVWISRCRTVDDFGQYFTQMNWLALPPDEAMGQRGQLLGDKYKVKGIPSLVLLDEIGNVITTDARNKIPADKAGIGFPWRSPLSVLISALVPRSFRLLVKTQLAGVLGLVKGVLLGKKGVQG